MVLGPMGRRVERSDGGARAYGGGGVKRSDGGAKAYGGGGGEEVRRWC